MPRGKHGFTLLELMMVVVIIGILATIAVPQYLKTVERARMAEAVSILGQLRSSQMRYRAASSTGSFTSVLADLDFNPADVAGTSVFTYAAVSAGAVTFDMKATRNATPTVSGGCTAGYVLHVSPTAITGQSCDSTT